MRANLAQRSFGVKPAAGLPDILTQGLSVVFCGINPGMRSAMLGQHFANRSNRFWRVLHRSGFTAEEIRSPDAESLLNYGYGLTSAVDRPTISASELKRSDFLSARPSFEQKIRSFAPRHLAFLGKPAYSAMFNLRQVPWGRQPNSIGQTAIWVIPNPSGLNRAFTLDALILEYRKLLDALEEDTLATAPTGKRIKSRI